MASIVVTRDRIEFVERGRVIMSVRRKAHQEFNVSEAWRRLFGRSSSLTQERQSPEDPHELRLDVEALYEVQPDTEGEELARRPGQENDFAPPSKPRPSDPDPAHPEIVGSVTPLDDPEG